MIIRKASALYGEINIPGDKSISHRAVMFGSIAKGTTTVRGFLQGDDCLSTISCFRKLGVDINNDGELIIIKGNGLHGLKAPDKVLDCGNSGTTTRLISGILAPQPFTTVLTGDASIQKRPMKRIIEPLSKMGADIISINGNGCAPLRINGKPLKGIHYISPVASAQVKSSVLLAGLYAEGETAVTEPYLSRNHTELMLRAFGANIESISPGSIFRPDDGAKSDNGPSPLSVIKPAEELHAIDIDVPGDISSAAYFIAAATLVPNSEITIKNVGINPTRDGILKAALSMGADIKYENIREMGGEPACDLIVKSASLHGTTIEGEIIPTLIDEIPVIAVMAAFADGQTVIKDASELKVKESDRIAVITENLRAMGCDICPTDDGMIINGGRVLKGAFIRTRLDHRMAMSFAVAALAADGETKLDDSDCVNISYPAFFEDLKKLTKER